MYDIMKKYPVTCTVVELAILFFALGLTNPDFVVFGKFFGMASIFLIAHGVLYSLFALSRKNILLMLLYLIVMVVLFATTGVLGAVLVIPILTTLIKTFVWDLLCRIFAPYYFIRSIFTWSFPGSPFRGEDGYIYYPNKFTKCVFWYGGNTVFYTLVIAVVVFLCSYRPYFDGYMLKQSDYSIGDTVVVTIDDSQFVGTVQNFSSSDENGSVVKVDVEGKSYLCGLSPLDNLVSKSDTDGKVNGLLCTQKDSTFTILTKSAMHTCQYAVDRLPFTIKAVTNIANVIDNFKQSIREGA